MPYNPDIHHRRSIRLRHYDYTQPGWYFVTICIQNRASLLGHIQAGKMIVNPAGQMVNDWWYKLPQKFPGIVDDAWIVMPNHVHGIITITDATPVPPPVCTLGQVVQWFKTMTTNAYIRGVKQQG